MSHTYLSLTLYRQRKALSPAFSSAAVRELTPVFYDATYKVHLSIRSSAQR